MLPKERVIAALNHREPDMVPTGENMIHQTAASEILGREVMYTDAFAQLTHCWDGKRDEFVDHCSNVMIDLAKTLEHDYIRVPAAPAAKEYKRPKMLGEYDWEDEKGNQFHFNPEIGQQVSPHYNTEMTIDDLPDPDEDFTVDPSELDMIKAVVAEMGDTHFIIGRPPVDGSFAYKMTVGIEEYLMRMILDPDFVKKASEVWVNRSIAYINAFFDAGVDAVMTTDDYADNRGLMMGHERFAELILPGLTRQVKAAHDRGGYFIKHTDGSMWDALDDFVEIGVNGWHGIQSSIGMDLKVLKEKYSGKLCFFGGVNVESLIEGTPESVDQEVKYSIQNGAPGGGLVLASGNSIEKGTSIENYKAMLDARKKYGVYPL